MGIDYFTKATDLTIDSSYTNVLSLELLLAFNDQTGITVRDWARFGCHAMLTNVSDGNWVDRGTDAWALRVNDGEGGLTLCKVPRSSRPALNCTEAHTWAFWVRRERIGMRGNGSDADTFGYFYFRQTGSQLRVQDDETLDYFDQFAWKDFGSTASGVLDCFMITASTDESLVRLYRNGDLVNLGPYKDWIFQTGSNHWIFNSDATANYGIEGELFMSAEWRRELSAFDVQSITTDPLVTLGVDKITGATPPGGGGGSEVTNTHSVGTEQAPIWTVGGRGGANVISNGMMDARNEMGFGEPQAHILDWIGGAD